MSASSAAEDYKGVARVTVVLVIAFIVAIGNQVATKIRLTKEYRARKEIFHRYGNAEATMITADRVVGNLVEWGFVFWPLFALSVVLFGGSGGHVIAGYVYAASRLFYVLFGLRVALPTSGSVMKTPLLLCTPPAYVALIYLVYRLTLAAL
jgi:hypothetical protein